MCGVVGFRSEDKPPKDWFVRFTISLLQTQSRGRDATGIYMWNGSKEILIKKPLTAEEFIKTPLYRKLQGFNPLVCLGHTRQKTQGSAEDNRNNHPLEWGSIVAIHNGIINNDVSMRRKYELPTNPEVDSFVIPAVLHTLRVKDGLSMPDAIRRLDDELYGYYVALIWDRRDRELYVMRNSESLWIGIEKRCVWYASEKETLRIGARFALGGRLVAPSEQPNANGRKTKSESTYGSHTNTYPYGYCD